jgi:hypothetical protein
VCMLLKDSMHVFILGSALYIAIIYPSEYTKGVIVQYHLDIIHIGGVLLKVWFACTFLVIM